MSILLGGGRGEYPQHDPIQVRIQLAAKLVPAIPELFGSQVKVLKKIPTAP